jgi:hypothetical protein
MKKLSILALLMLVMALVLSGCGGNSDAPQSEPEPQQQETSESVEQQETVEQEEPSTPSGFTQSYQDSLSERVPFSVDITPGWEYRDLSVNGEYRRVTITFEMESSEIDSDPSISYYKAEIIGEDEYYGLVAVGRAILSDIDINYLKECRENGTLYDCASEIFVDGFKASTFKGNDKDYIVFSVPAGWELYTSSMVIATDQGKLLAETEIDKTHQVKLQGEDVEKYMDHTGNTCFFSFSEDSITYLKVSQVVDGVTYLSEYSLNIDNDTITSMETGRTYQTTDTVPDLPDISVY